MPRRLKIPDETLKAVLADRKNGMVYRALAQKHNLSVGTVMRLVANRNAPKPHCPAIHPAWAKLPVEPETYWQDRIAAEHRRFQFLSVGGRGASLSVRDRQLVVFENGRETLFMPGTPPFRTLLMESFGSHITGDALAWLHRHDVCLIIACDSGEPMSISASTPLSKVELRQKQYARLGAPLPIAKTILVQKIRSGFEHDRFTKAEQNAITNELLTAPGITSLFLIEARAAALYFERFNAELKLRYKPADWPAFWCDWPGRLSPIGGMSGRHATHPVNALLNYAYSVAAAQLMRALTAAGLDPAAGYLHHPEDRRASLAYDALELMRADIDTRILSLLASKVWTRDDFVLTPNGIVRLTPSLARIATGRGLATKATLAKACDFMVAAVMK